MRTFAGKDFPHCEHLDVGVSGDMDAILARLDHLFARIFSMIDVVEYVRLSYKNDRVRRVTVEIHDVRLY
jgi:hypothetical protein